MGKAWSSKAIDERALFEQQMNANISDEGRALDEPQRTAGGKPTFQKTKAPTKAGSTKWLVAALLVLSAIPPCDFWLRMDSEAALVLRVSAWMHVLSFPLPRRRFERRARAVES
jgi:hypothetical protein